jgi:Bacterial Ig domain
VRDPPFNSRPHTAPQLHIAARVQNGGSAFKLDAAGNRTTISPFATVRGGCQPGPPHPPASLAPRPRTRRRPRDRPRVRRPPSPAVPDLDHQAPAPTDADHRAADDPATAGPTLPPTVQPRITAPASGATVNGIAMVTVTADGLSGIRRVDLYVDGVREQADYRGPFLFAWPAFTLPPGTHTLRAILIRINGSSLRSAPVTVETRGR